jgi:hypothetical protein
MGFSYGAYFVYGVHVPADRFPDRHVWAEAERLDGVIRELGHLTNSFGLSHLTAGDYDRDMLFLCIDIPGVDSEVSLGSFSRAMPTAAVPKVWDDALKLLARAAGYGDLGEPAWTVVPDCS